MTVSSVKKGKTLSRTVPANGMNLIANGICICVRTIYLPLSVQWVQFLSHASQLDQFENGPIMATIDNSEKIDTNDRTLHRSTARALTVIDLLSREDDGLTLADLGRMIGAPKSSLAPIVHTIVEMGYANFDQTSLRYSVGLKAYVAGKAYARNNNLIERLTGRMRKVVDYCNEACQMGILDHGETLYIAKVDSNQPVRIFSDVGAKFPLYCTAIGKCLVSDMSKEELTDFLPKEFKPLTSSTRKTLDELWSDIEELHETGFARDRCETTESLDCFAVPIRAQGKITYGLSVSVPSFRLTKEKTTKVEQALLSAKVDLERMLA